MEPDGKVREVVLEVPQPLVIQRYYCAANAIDIANQYRQGLLAIERGWSTHSWKIRIFQTLMGMMLCNGLQAYKYFEKEQITLEDYVDNVVRRLVIRARVDELEAKGDGDISAKEKTLRARAAMGEGSGDEPTHIPDHALHSCKDFGVGTPAQHKGRCKICHIDRAYHFCKDCSNMRKPRGGIYFICGPGVGRRHCYVQHMADIGAEAT